MWLLELKSFRTKKRSSDSATWVAWSSILAMTVVVGAVFTASQLAAMSQGSVRFLNVRVPTVEDFRLEKLDSGVSLGEASPVVYVGKDYVTIGAVKAVLSPRPEADVVLIKKTQEWTKEISSNLLAWKRAREVFPAAVFALAYENDADLQTRLRDVQLVSDELAKVNRAMSGSKTEARPLPVFVGFAARQLAKAHDANNQ
jgi:hypothetical protein